MKWIFLWALLALKPAGPTCERQPETAYACTQQAMVAILGATTEWEPRYVEALYTIAGVSREQANRGAYPLSECQLAEVLTTMSWWETTWTPDAVGSSGERGMTQVIPCEVMGCPCYPGYREGRRPPRAWFRADARNSLRWTAGYFQARGVSYHTLRRYNGGGAGARAYARRAMATLERIADFREGAMSLPPLRRNDPLWQIPRVDEPEGAW